MFSCVFVANILTTTHGEVDFFGSMGKERELEA